MAAKRVLDDYNYTEKQIEEAQNFLDTIGISPPNFTLEFSDAAVVWYIEKLKDKGSIFTKQQKDEYNSARPKGMQAVKNTAAYKTIFNEITDAILNLGVNPATGKIERPKRQKAPRQTRQTKQTNKGQGSQNKKQRGETNRSGPDIKIPDQSKPTDKFITTKLTDTLVYGDPKYNEIKLFFKNDFDRVAYILRNKKTRSKRHDQYFEWARLVSGNQTDDAIRQHGNKVLREIKRVVGKRTQGDVVIDPVPLDFDPPDPNEIKAAMRARNTPMSAGGGGSGATGAATGAGGGGSGGGRPPVSPASFMGRPDDSGGGSGQNIMARSARVVRGASYTEILDTLEKIRVSVESILDLLKKQQEINADIDAANRNYLLGQQRAARESASESFVKGLVGEAFKLIKPIQNMLERILNFIVYTILGRAVNALLDWLADPKNKEKVQAITRFLKDWWPLLLGTYVFFFTKFGKFVRYSIIGISKLTLTIGRQIPKLLKLLKQLGPVKGTAVGAAVVGLGALGYNFFNKDDTKDGNTLPVVPPTSAPKYNFGGLVSLFKPKQLHVDQISFAGGGNIQNDTGLSITGAGKDTQLIAAQPGEYVISKKAVDKYGPDFFEGLNKMAGSSNIPKMANNIQLAQQGGRVGGKNPNISQADYNTLLAIAAAEDSDPQGRADVAQSLYNRLLASGGKYNMNFMPTGGVPSLQNLITGEGQFEPTFQNKQDWLNIRDRKSAAIALARALAIKRGSDNIDINAAMTMLKETENALKNVDLQKNAQSHVGGRTSFFGTSQIGHMNKKMGDVMRPGGNDNFFSPKLEQESPNPGDRAYYKERKNKAAPVPSMFMPKQQPKSKPKPQQSPGIFGRVLKTFGDIFGISPQPRTAPMSRTSPPRRRTSGSDVTVLPPVDLRTAVNPAQYQAHPAVDISQFNLYPPSEFSDRDHIKSLLNIA